MEGIRAAVAAGFRVTTNTTLFDGADPNSVRAALRPADGSGRRDDDGVARATRMTRLRTRSTFSARRGRGSCSAMILSNRKKSWEFNTHPLFMEFLMGKRDFECTPWGMPTYSIFGWQKPCYLLQDGYADTFQELMDATEWANYGAKSGNPQCANCMVHSGYEASGGELHLRLDQGLLDDGEGVHVQARCMKMRAR